MSANPADICGEFVDHLEFSQVQPNPDEQEGSCHGPGIQGEGRACWARSDDVGRFVSAQRQGLIFSRNLMRAPAAGRNWEG